MGLTENIATVRTDVSTHAMNIFVEYFKKFPKHQDTFADYKGKDPESLKSLPKFKTHTTKVVEKLFDIVEESSDADALQANCKTLAKMPQHKGLNKGQFDDLGVVLVPYLKTTLGDDCDAKAWEETYKSVVTNVAKHL